MQTKSSSAFLRCVLAVDALSCVGMGLGLLAFPALLASWLNLPEALLRQAGIVLLPFAAFVGFLATRSQPPRIGVWVAIALNVLWVIESVLLLFSAEIEPSALGYAFVIVQAVVVGVLAELEYVGLRRASQVDRGVPHSA